MTDYQKYQLQWMIDHGYSLNDLVAELTNLQYDDPEDSDRISTPVSELFDEWVADRGFGSEIWVCEAEWRDYDGKGCDIGNVVNAEFMSVWDGNFCVTTTCKVNLGTKEIFDIEVSADIADQVDNLEGEYVIINGEKYPVIEHDNYDAEAETAGYYWHD